MDRGAEPAPTIGIDHEGETVTVLDEVRAARAF